MASVLEKVLRVGEGRILRKLEGYAKAVNALEDDFQELTDEAFTDLLKKHKQPVGLKAALKESVGSRPKEQDGRSS